MDRDDQTSTNRLDGPAWWVLVLLAIAGTAIAVVGFVAVFHELDGAAPAAAITIGAALIVLALLIPHFENISAGGVALGRRVARTESEVRRGVGESVEQYANFYKDIRTLPWQPEDVGTRTRILDRFYDLVAKQSRYASFTRQEIEKLFRAWDAVDRIEEESSRIVALALMSDETALRDNPKMICQDCITSAIGDSRSAFEQYHGLRVARKAVRYMTRKEQLAVIAAVNQGRRHYVDLDHDRVLEEQQLQEQLGKALGRDVEFRTIDSQVESVPTEPRRRNWPFVRRRR